MIRIILVMLLVTVTIEVTSCNTTAYGRNAGVVGSVMPDGDLHESPEETTDD